MRPNTQPLELEVTAITHERLAWLARSIFTFQINGANDSLTLKEYMALVVEHAVETMYHEAVKEL